MWCRFDFPGDLPTLIFETAQDTYFNERQKKFRPIKACSIRFDGIIPSAQEMNFHSIAKAKAPKVRKKFLTSEAEAEAEGWRIFSLSIILVMNHA
eukprot:scaffold4674_cov92-Skeletonema_dohrnii-CCMP3373.AAC.2